MGFHRIGPGPILCLPELLTIDKNSINILLSGNINNIVLILFDRLKFKAINYLKNNTLSLINLKTVFKK